MATVGAGVRETRIRSRPGAYRVLYVVESDTEVYVLHAFRKTTQRTAQADIAKGRARYALIP